MKQKLYVYIPGFEYDSKGPLHIDAIRLDVTAGELNKDKENNIQNSLKTYIYISELASDGTADKAIEGNLIYRRTQKDNNFFNNNVRYGYRSDSYTDRSLNSPFWTEKAQEQGRVSNGYFYDFITTSDQDERTHHIIGIHDTIKQCKDVSNLNTNEHDGLFAVEIDQLNVDLTFTFTFYSRINQNIVGKTETITTVSTYFNQESRPNFFDEYIEIGKWIQTYNPATSGVEDGKLEPYPRTEMAQQYFDLKNKGTTEDDWEIPVNAGVLVTKMQQEFLDTSLDTPIYKQFIYKNNHHVVGENLGYLSKIRSNSALFYTNFYSGFKTSYKLPTNINREFGQMYGWKSGVGLYYGRNFICGAEATVSYNEQWNYNYQLSYVDVSNLSYLYNESPSICICNLVNDSEVGGNNTKQLFVAIDSITCDYKTDTKSEDHRYARVFDSIHYNTTAHHPGNYNYGYANETPATYTKKAQVFVSCSFLKGSENISVLNNTQINLTAEESLSDQTILNYNTPIQSGRNNPPDTGLSHNNYYWGSINPEVSLFNSGQHIVELDNNQIELKLTVNDIKYPVILWGGTNANSALSPNKVKDYIKVNDPEVPKYPSYTVGGVTYNYQNFINTYKIGKVTIGIPQMFQIDLLKSKITYSNKSDHQVRLALVNNTNGYQEDKKVEVNVEEINLLDPNPEDTTSFEITRIVESIPCRNTNLRYSRNTSYETYDSTFCNDQRFFGWEKDKTDDQQLKTILINKEANLEANTLYVFKISNLYPTNSQYGFKLNYSLNGSNSSTIGYNNKWAFYSKTSCKLIIKSLSRDNWMNTKGNYDILSGIGLYKVNFNTQGLVTGLLKRSVTDLPDQECGFINFNTNKVIYDNIIFPAAFCAMENIKFCKRLGTYTKSNNYSDYNNDYCTNVKDDPVYHYYNFKYLPDKAIYDIQAFYKIPSESEMQINAETDIFDFNNQQINKFTFLGSEIVRI